MLKAGRFYDNIVKRMKNYMELALKEAKKAEAEEEVPVGAVIVKGNEIIAKAHNKTRQTHDPTAHAEILAIREASEKIGSTRLSGCTMYVTLEPCSMCVGALVLARLSEVVIGARDFKSGACGSALNVVTAKALNHKVKVSWDDTDKECGEILKRFFQARR